VSPVILGWKEHAALPDWGITRLRVKLDTGAKTSAIHARAIEQVGEHELDGRSLPVLRFVVPLSRTDPSRFVEVTAPVVGHKSVRDTRAQAEVRPVVRARLMCGALDRDIDVTLTDRSGMIFRMILGRQALQDVLVDPTRAYLLDAAAPSHAAPPRTTP
jgi:ribosomal protein S6--L-glutamate ligase